jgi:hypothetical protein
MTCVANLTGRGARAHDGPRVRQSGPTSPPPRFLYAIGTVFVNYTAHEPDEGVTLRLPGAPGVSRSYVVSGMKPGQRYSIRTSGGGRGVSESEAAVAAETAETAVADSVGVLRFSVACGAGCQLDVARVGATATASVIE